jgi:hypothetical protein
VTILCIALGLLLALAALVVGLMGIQVPDPLGGRDDE